MDDFSCVGLPIDAREPHVVAGEWSPDGVGFSVDGEQVKRTAQAPGLPIQLMLGVYHFASRAPGEHGQYPKEFAVDYVRGYRPVPAAPAA